MKPISILFIAALVLNLALCCCFPRRADGEPRIPAASQQAPLPFDSKTFTALPHQEQFAFVREAAARRSRQLSNFSYDASCELRNVDLKTSAPLQPYRRFVGAMKFCEGRILFTLVTRQVPEKLPPEIVTTAWDGKKNEIIARYPHVRGTFRASGDQIHPSVSDFHYNEILGIDINGIAISDGGAVISLPLPEFLDALEAGSGRTQIQVVTSEGKKFIEVRGSSSFRNFVVWLDPARDFMLARLGFTLDLSEAAGPDMRVTEAVQRDGVWVPIKARRTETIELPRMSPPRIVIEFDYVVQSFVRNRVQKSEIVLPVKLPSPE